MPKARVRGEVRALEWHGEFESLRGEHRPTTVTFRVVTHAPDGTPQRPVAVRAYDSRGILGPLADGDHVEVVGQWRAGLIVARGVQNLTTGSRVHFRRPGQLPHGCVLTMVGVGFMLLFVIGIVVIEGIFGDTDGGDRTVPDVVGLEYRIAEQRLQRADIDLFDQEMHGNPFCRVIRTDPPAGASLPAGEVVTIVVGPTDDNPRGCR